MLVASLIIVALTCFAWFVYEVSSAQKLAMHGVRCPAVVVRREWSSTGRTRNIRIIVSFVSTDGPIELPIGFMSWWGFRNLNPGDEMSVIHHPGFRYVVPASPAGIWTRSMVAGSLLGASSMIATAFALSRIVG
jgi:hypothetical protein